MKIRLHTITVLVLMLSLLAPMTIFCKRNMLLSQTEPIPRTTVVEPQRIMIDKLPSIDDVAPELEREDQEALIDEHEKKSLATIARDQELRASDAEQSPYADDIQESSTNLTIEPLVDLKNMVYPAKATEDEDEKIEVNLEDADLANVLDWISSIFKVTFLSDDILKPAGKFPVAGQKITFKTNTPLTKKRVWDLFLTWLDLSGLAVVPGTHTNFYKIVTSSDEKAPLYANRSPLPVFINVAWENLPNSDTRIRYVYLLENTTIAALQEIIKTFRSNTGVFQPLEKQNGFILTDKANNIRAVMEIVSELDKVTMPEGLSFLQLKHADAQDVKKMYDALTEADKKGSVAERLFGTKKQPTESYFSSDTRLFVEPRKNALIVLGTRDGIKKVEDFIATHIDTELKVPYSPLYVYELQYANADQVAEILTSLVKYGGSSDAAKYGGVRDGDKFFKPMTIIPEKSGNRLLITADKEDYIHLRKIIEQIDVKQPQIALEVLILDVVADADKELGTQIRSKRAGNLAGDVDFQASGLPSNQGTLSNILATNTRGLLTNLVNLAIGQTAGSTIISIGSESTGGVWAIFKMLQTVSNTTLVAKPFLITTNNYPATISFGESRYVVNSVISAAAQAQSFANQSANLVVNITPLINSDGIINLNVYVQNSAFTSSDPTDANRATESVATNANVYNGEILALGGLSRKRETELESRVPILGSIPLVGWFFKNKVTNQRKDNFLIFISAKIIEPKLDGGVGIYTQEKAKLGTDLLYESEHYPNHRDPIHRWFFADQPDNKVRDINNFLKRSEDIKHFDVSKSEYYKNYTTPASEIDEHQHYECKTEEVPQKEFLVSKQDTTQKRSIAAYMPPENKRVVA